MIVVSRDLHNPKAVIAIGKVDHNSILYRFACFDPSFGTLSLLMLIP